MTKQIRFHTVLAAGTLMICGSLTLLAQEEGPVPTTAVISVESKSGAPITADTLKLQVNGHDAPIESLTPVAPQGAELAILIDDGLRGSVSLRLDDLKQWLQQLPPSVNVLVGYMQNGVVRSAGFTQDHAAAASQVRIPEMVPGASASPYFCLSDFVRKWPSHARTARFVLMITNGVDPYNGSTSVMNQDSPYVQNAQEDAERAGVAVYALYYGDSGFRGARGSFSGQSYLEQVTQATGGESLYNGNIEPVSFTPFLNDLSKHMQESYILGFRVSATRERPDTLTHIKVKSTDGAKVHAPDNVHPGLVE